MEYCRGECLILTEAELSFVEFKTNVESNSYLNFLDKAADAIAELWHTYSGIIKPKCCKALRKEELPIEVDFYVVFDKDLMKKFEEEYKQYDYIIWESASSTKEWPKFRVIFLLDKPIEFVIEDGVKYTKKAIISIFSKFKPDQKASWYFTPTKSKVATVRRNKGIPFPSERLSWMTTSMMKTRQLYNTLNEHKLKELRTEHERNPDGWRNLPSVKRCLDGLVQGERDSKLNQACYAMKKLGYGDKIIEFIEEVELTSNLPKDMVRKFKNKYRG